MQSELSYFFRSTALLGADGVKRLSEARGIVFGVGGVGSWCAEALVRTGLGHISLVDPDVVVDTNVNRQLPATAATLGRLKTEVMKERLESVVPGVRVEIFSKRYTAGEADFSRDMLSAYDFIIDAIDSVDDKAALIQAAVDCGVPVFSSMGAARRLDPAKVRTGFFKSVSGDKLAKALRNRFRKTGAGVIPDFRCVYSEELPVQCEVLGSLMQVTAVFGMCLASLAVAEVTGAGAVCGGKAKA